MRHRPTLIRFGIGIAISAIFLGLTLSQVDLPGAGAAIAAAAPGWLAIGLLIVLVDIALRALRWLALLDGVRVGGPTPPYRLAFGYLSIGFLANAVLPARLGDLGRAYLAGTAFQTPRLAIFGTIMIERVSDGLTMLLLAIVAGFAIGAATGIGDLVLLGVVGVTAGTIGLLVAWLVLTRTELGRRRIGAAITDIGRRLGAGAGAFRTPAGAATFLGLTAVVTMTAILIAWAAANSVGLDLTPLQLILFLSGIALSLAIPAAPGALGTYEFVGVTIVTSLGYTPEQGLATILLMRLLTVFPPAILGLISLWALQIRPRNLVTSSMAQAEQ